MSNSSKINVKGYAQEYQIIQFIKEFFEQNSRTIKNKDFNVDEAIFNFCQEKQIYPTDESHKIMTDALKIQCLAMLYYKSIPYSHNNGGQTSFGGNTFIYVGGGSHGHSGCGSGDGGEIMLAIATVFSAILAAYGMGKDIYEISNEMYNSQRVAANIAILSLTSAYVTAATIAALAIFASNPVTGAVIATAALVIGVAILVKVTRAIINRIDAALTCKSGLTTDSRFKLTEKEAANLLEKGFTDDGIDKIRHIIRGFAVQAKSTSQVAFFGSSDAYRSIIAKLTAVKKGDVSADLKQQYKFSDFKERYNNQIKAGDELDLDITDKLGM